MNLPVKFPSETEVILEDVARFRALSPEDRIRSLRGLMASGAHLMRISPKKAWIEEDYEEQRQIKRRSIQEFITRHAP